MQQDTSGSSSGKVSWGEGQVLVLEDDLLLAKCFGRLLVTLGVPNVTIVHDNAQAIRAIETSNIAAAFIDVKLEFETSEKTAHVLKERNIPFAFVSGRTLSDLQRRDFPAANLLLKPARKDSIVDMLARLHDEADTRSTALL